MKSWLTVVSLLLVGLTPMPIRSGPLADQYGDPLPTGALARLGSTRWRTGLCTYVEYSGDGKSIFTSYLNFGSTFSSAEWDVVRQWDRATGKESKRWMLPRQNARGRIIAVNVSRDRAVSYRRDEVLEVINLRHGTILFSSKEQGLDTAALSLDAEFDVAVHGCSSRRKSKL